MLAKDALSENPLGFRSRFGERQDVGVVSADGDELAIGADLHKEAPRTSLRDATAEGGERLVVVELLPFDGQAE